MRRETGGVGHGINYSRLPRVILSESVSSDLYLSPREALLLQVSDLLGSFLPVEL